jgi:hypothetical protein
MCASDAILKGNARNSFFLLRLFAFTPGQALDEPSV